MNEEMVPFLFYKKGKFLDTLLHPKSATQRSMYCCCCFHLIYKTCNKTPPHTNLYGCHIKYKIWNEITLSLSPQIHDFD